MIGLTFPSMNMYWQWMQLYIQGGNSGVVVKLWHLDDWSDFPQYEYVLAEDTAYIQRNFVNIMLAEPWSCNIMLTGLNKPEFKIPNLW